MDTKPFCPACGKPMEANAPRGLCPECLLRAAFPTGTDDGGKAPRFVPPTVEELAAKFPQLEILQFIGQGGMGAVYKARQKQLDRIVGLKILPPRADTGPGFAERFTREARALAKLNHAHIVTLYEFGQADGLFYFLMEFVDGVNLRQLLNNGRIAPKEALAIVPQICDALQYAHERGIVHRDIKPENILLSREGEVKIADFGVAKIVAQGFEEIAKDPRAASGELTEAGSTVGTPRYMAPEQTKNSAEVDHRADIYSLGVVFYQMLTGELPSGKIERPSKKVVIDVRLDEVVMRALASKPEMRYQNVSEVKQEVETIAGTPSEKSASQPERQLLHFAGILKFRSAVAFNFARLASLGFLGFLGGLGFISGSEQLFRLAGFFGFFGFIGVAYVIEAFAGSKGGGDKSLARIALWIACLSGIFGGIISLFILNGSEPPASLVWAIPATALLGIVLGSAVRKQSSGKIATVVGGINLAIWIFILIAGNFIGHPPWNPGAQNLTFGPVREQTISIGNKADSFFSFDSGDYVGGPTDFDPAENSERSNQLLWKWLTEHNVDLLVQRNNGRPILAMSDMVVGAIDAKDFDQLTPKQVTNNQFLRNNLAVNMRPNVQAMLTGAFGGPVAVVFQTRNEVEGVLLVKSINGNPPRITVRYKLVEKDPMAASVQRNNLQRNLAQSQKAQTFQKTSLSQTAQKEQTNEGLFFSPVREIGMDEASIPFVSLATGQGFGQFRAAASQLEQWEKQSGVDLAIQKLPSGKLAIRAVNMITKKVADISLPDVSMKTVMDNISDESPDLGTNAVLEAGATYLFMNRKIVPGALQIEAIASPPGVKVRYKMIQTPSAFGPIIERSIEFSGTNRRALNLLSGNYVTLPAGAAADYSGNGNPAFRAAGIDLFSTVDSNAPGLLALDMQSWEDDNNHSDQDLPPGFGNPWESLDDFPPLISYLEKSVFANLDTNKPENVSMLGIIAANKMRRARGCEDIVHGTNVCNFTARDGTEGILQVVGHYDNEDGKKPESVKIRYRLVQPSQGK